MPDNTLLDAGTGGDTIRTDLNGSVKTPVSKIELGADGFFDGFVCKTIPMPAGGNTQADGLGDLVPLLVDAAGNLQIDVIASLPAGTNAIGKLAANSGVDIGDVDVTSLIPGSGATNLGKAQDVAAGANDVGVAILAVRDDVQAAMTPADGDYSTLRTDKFGALKTTAKPDATSETKRVIIDGVIGDKEIVALASGKKIRVLSFVLISAGGGTARFESGPGGAALTGEMALIASSGLTAPYNPDGWFETVSGESLSLELSAATADGFLTYVEV